MSPIVNLHTHWDLVVIGGGVTGAGIFREAARAGLKVLLVEQRDFAWGTSSRSSKLIHGGLRYLREGRIHLTHESVKERERLLTEAPGLVVRLPFLVPVYRNRKPGKWTLEAGLSIYDLIAKKRQHRFLEPEAVFAALPWLDRQDLVGAFEFSDAQVDDARLVLRLIADGVAFGGTACNYTTAVAVVRNDDRQVTGLTVQDSETGQSRHLSCPAIINATGWWAEQLHPSPQPNLHLRPLRGSHLILPSSALPVEMALSFVHPRDGRALFIIPWEGAVMVGTTDLDHEQPPSREPCMEYAELTYLLEAIRFLFPSLGIGADTFLSSFAGVRPVLSKGNHQDPSAESREHTIWVDQGLVTVTGGKMTTFRLMALETLKAAAPFLHSEITVPERESSGFDWPAAPVHRDTPAAGLFTRLYARFGEVAREIIAEAPVESLVPIEDTCTVWAELTYSARYGQIRHLDDLLLRRTRLGLLLENGGTAQMDRIRQVCEPELHWGRRRWRREIKRYQRIWCRSYAIPKLEQAPANRLAGFWNQLRGRCQ